ncbi:uncharacterized protein BP01DRAFT_328182 [Aspergillus saccharolyticus JOP 1030-1]|uniref:Methyltransferase domain-containing protein n=1 Tax=Aspergillus saccharolyticus JOP 1030-1 TaxID=1450539 RepID=A0A318ZLS0_9EURO|nr:hypothetical protein BP01DRAFT_328182 [Aspergillus saccharolyticus JOP 1030-1]PYH41198.1 hypothetical protein BP01DRAFT_328182 [Aspergillus saccharolyticus JOP 1030-1]
MSTSATTTTTTTIKPAWYQPSVTTIDPAAQSLLEEYSGLAPEEVLPHVLALRDEAFDIFPYPCIGQMRFLSWHLGRLPFYEKVLAHLRASPANGFLDAGCCVGQEMRHLVHRASIPAAQLYGFDLEPGFFELGYKLFRDNAETFPATFVSGDLGVEDEDWARGQIVAAVRGKVDVVWAGSLLHFWDYEGQVRGVQRLIGLTRDKPGTVVCGRQMGSTVAGMYELTGLMDRTMHYRHDVGSLQDLWREVEARTGSKWEVQAGLEVGETTVKMRNMSFVDDNARVIWWCATRVQ